MSGDGGVWAMCKMTHVWVLRGLPTHFVWCIRGTAHTPTCGQNKLMPTHLFFPSRTLSHACVWGKVDNTHTPVCQASYPPGPAREHDAHRAPAVAMVQTLVHVRLTAVAMSDNYSCHLMSKVPDAILGQLRLLPCMVWFTIVAMIS